MATIDSLPCIDMTTITQSELRDLSLCSTSTFDLNRLDDVVIPIIDRSFFNESAGSKRQTFSRPTTTTTHHHHHLHVRHRVPALPPSSKQPVSSVPPHLDHEHLENRSILNFLKQSLSQSPNFHDIEFLVTSNHPVPNEEVFNKRKRGRKPKAKDKSLEENLEIVNKNGMVVDIVGLGNLEDPYREELRKRTEGMGGNEEQLLAFMRDLGGQWCSRRKRRKIVDANVLGDTLPVDWKLLLGLRRREGRATVYCRRYISPGGHHFLSCKEVSDYLQSYFGLHDDQKAMGHGGENIQQENAVASESHAGVTQKENDQRQSNEQQKQVALFGIDNLAEVQIRDLFECHKCEMTFEEKDTYLQHLLSFHQRTTRRYRLGSSVGDGVIIKDGKFECQFCHKVFHERRRYNGHVGIHVRNYVRGIEESPGQLALQNRTKSPTKDEFPIRISKMDALIEIAQNSILETSPAGPSDEANGGSATDKLNVVSNSELPASISDRELNSDTVFCEAETDDDMIDGNLDHESHQQNDEHMIIDEKMEKIDDDSNVLEVKMDFGVDTATALSVDEQNRHTSETFDRKDGMPFITDEVDESGIEQERDSEINLLAPPSNQKDYLVESNLSLGFTNALEPDEPVEVNNNKNIELGILLGSNNDGAANDNNTETVQQTFEENVFQYGDSQSSMSLLQPSHGFPVPNAILNKGEDEACMVDQMDDSETGFEDLRLDEIEHLKYNFGTERDSLSLPEVSIELGNNEGIEDSYGSSVQFESEEVLLNMASRHHLTTPCVWCGIEFSHEAVDSEIQSDSVGYMCPACKAKISGQLGGLGSG